MIYDQLFQLNLSFYFNSNIEFEESVDINKFNVFLQKFNEQGVSIGTNLLSRSIYRSLRDETIFFPSDETIFEPIGWNRY